MSAEQSRMRDTAAIFGEQQMSIGETLKEVGKACLEELKEMGWFYGSIGKAAAAERGVFGKLVLIGLGAAVYTFLPNLTAEAKGTGDAGDFGLDLDIDDEIHLDLDLQAVSPGPDTHFGLGHVGAATTMNPDSSTSQIVLAEITGAIFETRLMTPPNVDEMVHIEVRSDINQVNADLGRGGVFPGSADLVVFETQLTQLGVDEYTQLFKGFEPNPQGQLFVAIEHVQGLKDSTLTLVPLVPSGEMTAVATPEPGVTASIPQEFSILKPDGSMEKLLTLQADGSWALSIPDQGAIVIKEQMPNEGDALVAVGGKFTNFVIAATVEPPLRLPSETETEPAPTDEIPKEVGEKVIETITKGELTLNSFNNINEGVDFLVNTEGIVWDDKQVKWPTSGQATQESRDLERKLFAIPGYKEADKNGYALFTSGDRSLQSRIGIVEMPDGTIMLYLPDEGGFNAIFIHEEFDVINKILLEASEGNSNKLVVPKPELNN